jgi:cell pole-organizing protein PopZ
MGDVNHDPSMEEILASIKRVIAEETPPPSARSRAPRAQPDAGEAEDVLELNQPVDTGEPLISEDAAQSSRQALAALSEISQQHPHAAAGEGPLDAVVREMLRPMLKQWLDERLPEMVEDMVRQEIARITGRSL